MGPQTVGFQGEAGSYSEEAVAAHFGPTAVPRPFRTVADVFEAVGERKVDAGMIPVENSIGGNVYESYDMLISSPLHVTAEVYLKIHHCLIANNGVQIQEVRKVFSHPQAIEQCRKHLSGLGVEMVSSYDTAGSVRGIKESASTDSAALASSRAAEIHGLSILERNIEDSKNNTTRFLVVSREPVKCDGKCKSSIVFQVTNSAGSLYNALGIFARRSINLSKIESRPTRDRPWEYFFLLDFIGSLEEDRCIAAMEELRKAASFVRVLGSYPQGEHS